MVTPRSCPAGQRGEVLQTLLDHTAVGLAIPVLFPDNGEIQEARLFIVAPEDHPQGHEPVLAALHRFGEFYRLLGSIQTAAGFNRFQRGTINKSLSRHRDNLDGMLRHLQNVQLIVPDGTGLRLQPQAEPFTKLMELLETLNQ